MTDRNILALLFGAAALGTLYRLAPIALGEEALARFFITEDGYLMLTIARNLALGQGLSVSDGTIATNGVQPLATFLYALPYFVTGGDKVASLIGVIALMTAWSVAGFFAVRAFATRALAPFAAGAIWPTLAATLWFLGPLPLAHSMNGLETGLYVALVALTVTVFGDLMAKGAPYARRDQILFGALCGLTFLARIDGALLVTALFLVRFVYVQATGRLGFAGAVREALPPGLIALAVAAPWLIHNQILFGSIMPISGSAQSVGTAIGRNLQVVPVNLFETMLPMLPVPQRLLTAAPAQLAALLAIVSVLAAFIFMTARRRDGFAPAIWAYLLFGVAITGYYGLFFGAGHFINRYFAPLAPLLICAALSVGLMAARALRLGETRIPALAGLAAVALCLGLLGRLVLPGVKQQGHFQVVEWVRENVAPPTWVGAVQTGTLGYWHDRTVNLDGKVNPGALRARVAEGHVLGYVVASEIAYVVDWAGVGEAWSRRTEANFNRRFELVLLDEAANLSVMRRVP